MTLTALRTLSWALVASTVSSALFLSTARIPPGDDRERLRRLAASDAAPTPAPLSAQPALQRLAAARDFIFASAALPDH